MSWGMPLHSSCPGSAFLRRKDRLSPSEFYILRAQMYILAAQMHILAAQMYILAAKI